MTESGYVKAQSDNLPKLDVFMLSNYYARNPDFTSAEIKGVKAERSKRESYGDSAIGYVQIKREGDECTVKAKITPEHNVRMKSYDVTVVCDEAEETVLSAQCENCAAHKGGCKHTVAFLAWLHRRSEDPPSTSVDCFWKKSKLSRVGTSLKFIKAKDICAPPKPQQPKRSKLMPTRAPEETFLSLVKNYSMEVGNMENQLMKYYKEPSNCEKLSIHNLVSMIQKKPQSADLFIEFCKQTMQSKSCEEAALATIDQSDCPLWHELRYARITASKAYEAAHCKVFNGSLTETIMGASKHTDTNAMKRGRLLENEVIKVVKKSKKIDIKKCGLILNPIYPIMGASPDGESAEYSIEIKCPSSEKSMSNYICKNNMISAKCMAQVQLQMHFSKKNKALFCVAHSDFETSSNVTILEVDYDGELCKNLIEKCTSFWCNAIFPILFR